MTRYNAHALGAMLLMAAAGLAAPGLAAAGTPPVPAGPMTAQSCFALAERAPARALAVARSLEQAGGGAEARSCEGMALILGGHPRQGATILADIAGHESNSRAAIGLYGQAAWGWMRAGKPGRAETMDNAALAIAPDDVDLHVDRAYARAEQGKYWDALDDLTFATAHAPKRADLYVLRAQTKLRLEDPAGAAADVATALTLDPRNGEALLLRGNIRGARGDVTGAVADWHRAAALAPGSTTARAAEDNIRRFKKGP